MKYTQILSLGVAALALASCGGSGDGLSEAQGSLSKESATAKKSQIKGALPTSLSGTGTMGGAAGIMTTTGLNVQADDLASCTTKTPAETTDADEDGLPVTLTVTYDCKDIGETKLSQTGSYTLKDSDDANALGGYEGSMDFSSSYSNELGLAFEYAYAGTFSQKREAAKLSGTTNYTVGVKGEVGGKSFEANSAGSNLTYTFTGTDAEDIGAAGTAEITGFHSLGYSEATEGEIKDVVLSISTKDLTYDSSCGGFYKTGSFTVEDGESNKIVFTYDNCDETVTYNGEAI